MSRLFSSNAYNVLGLDTTVGQRGANKRAKEIVNLLKIDELLAYDTDLKISKPTRNESSIKDALQRLTSPSRRIKEYFFWFEIENDNDESALKLLSQERYDEVILAWQGASEKETGKAFTAKKNLAILASILLIQGGQKKYLTQSISLWRDLVESSKFWSHFSKVYALNDEVGTSESAMKEFKDQVVNDLSDFYTEVSQLYKDNSYYSLFSKIFGVTGKKMQNEVLSPIYDKINNTASKLEGLNISEDNIISPEEVTTLRRLMKQLQDEFQNLKDLGLYENSQSKTMRDKAAEAIRTVGLDLFNNLSESTKTIALFNIALSITGTPGLRDRLNADMKVVKKSVTIEKVVKPINELLGEEKYPEALELILSQQDKHSKDKVITEYFNTRIQWCVTAIASEHFIESKNLFEKNHYADAAPRFDNVRDFIDQYIQYFDFNSETLASIISNLQNMMSNVQPGTSTDNIDEYRQKIMTQAEEAFSDEQLERTILVILVDSIIYGRFSELIPKIKKQNLSNKVKGWIWTIIIFIVIAIIAGASHSGSSSSGSSSGSSSSCSTELTAIKTQLDSVEASMKSYESSGNNDAYNNLVPQQNSLVNSYNAKLQECQ
jgi:hypothetical protein